jgi:hypothetical protein
MQIGKFKLGNYIDKATGNWHVTWLGSYMRMTYKWLCMDSYSLLPSPGVFNDTVNYHD